MNRIILLALWAMIAARSSHAQEALPAEGAPDARSVVVRAQWLIDGTATARWGWR